MYIAGGDVKWFCHCGKWFESSSKNWAKLPNKWAILLLGKYLKELKIDIQMNTYTNRSTAALFTTVTKRRSCKHTQSLEAAQYPSRDE